VRSRNRAQGSCSMVDEFSRPRPKRPCALKRTFTACTPHALRMHSYSIGYILRHRSRQVRYISQRRRLVVTLHVNSAYVCDHVTTYHSIASCTHAPSANNHVVTDEVNTAPKDCHPKRALRSCPTISDVSVLPSGAQAVVYVSHLLPFSRPGNLTYFSP
jgi:hypothetical protein